jgi:spore coat-associated protein N
MPLLRRLLTSALVVVAASALCVCAALASARPLVAQRYHPRLAIVHRALPPVTRLAPGDRAQRTVDLRYVGKGQLSLVVLRVRGLSRVPLGAAADGVRLKIDRCSARWTRSRRTRTYACRGKHSVVLGTVAVGSKQPFRLDHLTARGGRTDHLLLTLSVPLQAGNSLQGLHSKAVYAFTGL